VLRQPSRLASQPVIGVATAVATRLRVMTQEISSWVAEKAPLICGSTTLASVIVMPNSRVESCTVRRISHCRPLMLKRLSEAGAGFGGGPEAAAGANSDCCSARDERGTSATDKMLQRRWRTLPTALPHF
jgi:hypothetical protein